MSTPHSTPQVAAVIGAGTIGLGWAGLMAAHGWQVRVFDPRHDLSAALDQAAANASMILGLAGQEHDIRKRLTVAATLADAVRDVDLVQEAGPERVGWKRETFSAIEKLAPAQAVLATSSSSITATDISRDNLTGGQMIVGHPFNPVLAYPLVEVVPGESTAAATTSRALELYRALGRTPVVINKEIPCFVINRLQRALILEAMYLVKEEVVTPEALDEIVQSTLGVRWAAVGPLRAMHIGGGPGGARHMAETIGREMQGVEMGQLDDAEALAVADVVDAAFGGAAELPITAVLGRQIAVQRVLAH